jgi:hypothetical protein
VAEARIDNNIIMGASSNVDRVAEHFVRLGVQRRNDLGTNVLTHSWFKKRRARFLM